jgi:hypothetical protein
MLQIPTVSCQTNFLTIVMFVIFNTQRKLVHKNFMICLHTKFHTPGSNNTYRHQRKGKCRICPAAILLFYVVQKMGFAKCEYFWMPLQYQKLTVSV